jgi:flagellin-like protein
MNIWGKNERSWRRKNKRAVSPIIATILLVAITVVLAAVLYILIQQYTSHGSSGVPLGSALAFGNSADSSWTCTSGTSGCTASGAALSYNFTVESASSTLTIGNVIFQLKSPGNSIVSTAGLSVAITNVKGAVEGVYNLNTAAWGSFAATCGTTFNVQCGTTTVISTQNLIALVEVGAVALQGYSLVALGSGGYQGTVPASVT